MTAPVAAYAQAAEPINIPAQPLASALYEFGTKTGRQISFTPDIVTPSKTSSGVSGMADEEAALRQLLVGTGLTYARSANMFVIQQEGGSSPQSASASDGNDVEALIVTAQKKEEAIQDVPIAISAFTQKSLDAQKIEGGFDLLKAIPNVTFSKNNFTGYNFSIRGIGTKAISATTDPGVAVSYNNTTLIVNRLFEQEYVDVERVEVLRGPQGTLYGRNATSGVINVISAKPRLMEFEGDIKLETGNFNAQRARGMVNIPLGDRAAIRFAGAMTKRDGYATNLIDGQDVDDRDLWTGRVTLGWEPNEAILATLMWERFEEDDGRLRSAKQLCHTDPGLSPTDYGLPADKIGFSYSTTQGCLGGSLYEAAAFGLPNAAGLPFVVAAQGDNTDVFNIYTNATQSHDLREIEMSVPAAYRAKSDIFDLTFDVDLGEAVTFTSQTLYTKDEVWSTQDLNRFKSNPGFFPDSLDASDINFNPALQDFIYGPGWGAIKAAISPGGEFCDPQLGCSDRLLAQDLSRSNSEQFNQEFRLASNFDGAVNFSVGANFTHFETENDYFVFINALTYIGRAEVPFYGNRNNTCGHGNLPVAPDFSCWIYNDPNPIESVNGEGHNYFRSRNPYELSSAATFGELYWQVTPTVKLTAGLRFTWDKKTFTPVPSQTLLMDYRYYGSSDGGPSACFGILCPLTGTGVNGRGYPAEPDIVQEWREPTGRVIVDWKPDLGFTDETLLYASYAHGYKGGGMNPPSVASPQGLFNKRGRTALAGPTFEPEFIDAFEVGSKNTLLDGALVLNGSAFFYDYKGYQISKIVDRSASNENFDARIWGAELEWIFSPTRNLRFNGAFGALRTELGDGQSSIDLMNRGGHFEFTTPDGRTYSEWVVIKPGLTQTTNCLVPLEIIIPHLLVDTFGDLTRFCAGGNMAGANFRNTSIPGLPAGTFFDPGTDAPNGGAGLTTDVSGHELPNAPHWTASLGAQYRFALPGGWDGTVRGDFYWQSQSYARVYNTQYDKLRAWTNTNLSLWVENPDWGVTAEVYVKNVFEETPITDAFLFSDDTGLTTNIFTLDPRLVGVSVRKSF